MGSVATLLLAGLLAPLGVTAPDAGVAQVSLDDGVAVSSDTLAIDLGPDGVSAHVPVVGATSVGSDLAVSLPTGLTGESSTQPASDGDVKEEEGNGLIKATRRVAETWQALEPVEKTGILATLAGLIGLMAAAMVRGGLFAWTLFSRIEPQELESQETRGRITEHLRAEPGASPQEIRRSLDLAWGTVVYHLDRLERAGLVVSTRRGGRRRYWCEGMVDRRDRKHLVLLRSPTTRRVALLVAQEPGIRPSALSDSLGIGRPTASKHLKRLVDDGLVESQGERKARHYFPTEPLQSLAGSMGA